MKLKAPRRSRAHGTPQSTSAAPARAAAPRPATRRVAGWWQRFVAAVSAIIKRMLLWRDERLPLVAERLRPVWETVQTKTRPVTSMVSTLGWTVFAAAVVLGFMGWRWGWLEFRVLAVLGAVVLIVGVLFTFGRWNYTAAIELENRRVRIGAQVLGQVVIRNGDRASASTHVQLPVGLNVASFEVPRLAAGEEFEQGFRVPTRRRGVITVGPVRSVRRDPLGLFHRQRSWTDPVELFVHPDTVRLESRVLGFLKDVEGVTTQNLSSSDVSFHALREYIPGDDRRSIHWRTTARTGKLMVRQFEETMRSHLLLLLSLSPDDYLEADDFEIAVSVVGSLGRAALAEERELTVYVSTGELKFPSATGLLDALSRLELVPRACGLRELATTAAAEVPTASVAGFVTGGAIEAADLRAAQILLPPEVSTFGVRCAADLDAARRRASSMVVLDVASLTDLQRGMRTL